MIIVGLLDALVKKSSEQVIAALSRFCADVTGPEGVVNLSLTEQKKRSAV